MTYFTFAKWQNLMNRLGVPATELIFAGVQAFYTEPARRYHNSKHIESCLTYFEEYRDLSERAAEAEFSLWMHDLIYDTRRTDNESLSARYAVSLLEQAGSNTGVLERVRENILGTTHQGYLPTPDAQLTADIDLIILGRNEYDYCEFEVNIREEYMHIDFEVYARRRIEILQGILDQDQIYYTAEISEKYEDQAESNLAQVIRRLKDKLAA